MTALNKYAALRKELLNPAIGSNHHLRKLALALLDENLQLQRDKDSLEAAAIAMRDDMREAREKLEAAEKRIAELEARTVVNLPDGYVVAPAKANIAMIRAGGQAARKYLEEHGGNSPQAIYQAMLAAAGIGVKGE